MKELKDLIKNYQELGEFFAEVETRLLALENSLSTYPKEVQSYPGKVSCPLDRIPCEKCYFFSKYQGRLIHLEEKVMEQRAKKGKRVPKYK